jgi:hypothetical protein
MMSNASIEAPLVWAQGPKALHEPVGHARCDAALRNLREPGEMFKR